MREYVMSFMSRIEGVFYVIAYCVYSYFFVTSYK